MSEKRPKVSVGMPVYNGEAFLEAAIESLLAQTFTDFELVISDNASTDRTEEICRAFAARDSRVRYDRLDENLGAVPNFNRVFELSRAEYFKWAAADDVCAPTFLERLVEVLDARLEIAWCHSRSTHIDSAGEPLTDADAVDVSYAAREGCSAYQRFQQVVFGGGGCLDTYGLMRSEAIRKTPLILPHYGAEKVFVAELALLGGYQEVPEVLFYPRVHAGGAGNLDTAAAQQAYMNTRGPAGEWMRLKLLQGYVSAVWRTRLSPVAKMRCFGVIARYVLQVGKWKRIFLSTLRGAGIHGGNVERVRRLQERETTSTKVPSGNSA